MSAPLTTRDNGTGSNLVELFRVLTMARHIDTLERRYASRGQAPFHVSGFGHAASAALASFLTPADYLHLHYRDKALMLARGVTPLEFFLALFYKRDSNSQGRQLNALMSSRELNILSIVGAVGNSALQSVGVAAAIADLPGRPIVVCSMGDGTTQQGEVLEAIAEAARSALPVLFLVHDNGYSISTPTAGKTFFSTRPDGSTPRDFLGVPIHHLDGTNPAECYGLFNRIVEVMREEQRPVIAILNVDRLDDHSNADDQSIYRSPEAINTALLNADPLKKLREQLLHSGTEEITLSRIEQEAWAIVDAAASEALNAANPSANMGLEDKLPEASPAELSAKPAPLPAKTLTMLESLRESLRFRLETDPRVVLYGQDIEDPKGDIFGVTRGLSTQFPQRVINAPLTESTIIGTAIGRALAGQRPVAFLPFVDFMPLAFNQITTELATIEWRTGGTWKCPVLILANCGGYKGGLGPFHAQTMEGFATHVPGLDVIMPSNASDAASLLQAAFESDRPTLFLYPKSCLNDRTLARETSIGLAASLARAEVLRAGRDISIVGWGATVPLCMGAAEALAGYGGEAEVIDLKTLAPWDFDTVHRSVKKTSRLIVVHEDSLTGGFGAEIIARLAEAGTKAEFRRVTRPDTYIPCNLENQLEVLPDTPRILSEAAAMLGITLAAQPDVTQEDDDLCLYTVKAFGLSPSDDRVSIIHWHVKPGDNIQEGDLLAEVEADKSSGELDAPVGGTVEELLQPDLATVPIGTPLLVIRTLEPVLSVRKQQTEPATAAQHTPSTLQRFQRSGSASRRSDKFDIIAGPIVAVTGQSTLTNEDLAKRFETTPEAIFQKIGIDTRPRVPPNTSPADLAWKSVAPLLDSPDFDPELLSIIIACTSTVDQVTPSISCQVLGQIQRYHPETNAMAFDILAACTGWLYGLRLAYDHLRQPHTRHKTALIITSEVLSPLVAPDNFATSISFGDAATATLVFGPDAPRGTEAGVAPVAVHRPVVSAFGDYDNDIVVPPMGTGSTIHMNGRAVRPHTVPSMVRALRQAADEVQVPLSELASVIAHQSNHRILIDLAAALGLPTAAVPCNIRNLGNTSSCTLPLLLNDLRSQNSLKAGTNIGFAAVGGGYTYGAAVGLVL